MSKMQLTLACGDYDFLRPLINGEIQPQGIDLNVLTMPSPERHGRMLRHEEFDICELSLVGYLVSRDKGCGYNAIPVFPHRRFRHRETVGFERTESRPGHTAKLRGTLDARYFTRSL
jgi:4,5-dihydroxyphthalate decarboxylase